MFLDNLDARKLRRIARLFAINEQNNTIYPHETYGDDTGLSIKDEFRIISEFQQRALNQIFRYILDNGIILNDSYETKIGIEHITNMNMILSVLHEGNQDKDILFKYENPSLNFYLEQIKKHLDGEENRALREKIEHLINDKKKLQIEIETINNHVEQEHDVLVMELNKKEELISRLLKEKEIESLNFKETLDRLNNIIDQKSTEILAKEKEKENILEEKEKLAKKMENAKIKVREQISALHAKLKQNVANAEKVVEYQQKIEELEEQIKKIDESKSKTSEIADDKLEQLESEITELNNKNLSTIKDKEEIEEELSLKKAEIKTILEKQDSIKNFYESQLSTLQESIQTLVDQKSELESKLMQTYKHSVRNEKSPQVKMRPFTLLLIDLNNICISWNKVTKGLRFRIEFLYDQLITFLKSHKIDVNINSLKSFIFASKNKEYLKMESDAIKDDDNNKLSDLAKTMDWHVNTEKKGEAEDGSKLDQDIDTDLALQTGLIFGEFKGVVEQFILVSGDYDFACCITKAKELKINTINLAYKKNYSKRLKALANEFYFLSTG